MRFTDNSRSTADSTVPGAPSQQNEPQPSNRSSSATPDPARIADPDVPPPNEPPAFDSRAGALPEPALAAGSDAPSPEDPTRTSQRTQSPFLLQQAAPPTATQVRDPRRYRVLGEHGRGGLGRVSRAHDVELGRDVAIKELIARNHIGEVRFLREALITARLEHPGIVAVHEAGRWPDGTPFYAMKLVSGRPLRDLIAERKTVDERLGLLHHVIAVADAIAYAHGQNIIHRDLKPSNVIVGSFGETIVIDWGLAKDITATDEPSSNDGQYHASQDEGLTSAGAILGTPAYMPPEQARGEPVDQRADVYAIGVMLWELCTLHSLPPNYSGQRKRILQESGIDQDLITIVEKSTASDPGHRYVDAGALATDLKAFKAGTRIAARRYSLPSILAHWIRRHRTLAWSTGSAVILAIAISVLYVQSLAVERDRTNRALQRERKAKDELVLEHAALLLHSDPTAALVALGNGHANDPSHKLDLQADSVWRDTPSGMNITAPYKLSYVYGIDISSQLRAAQVAADALGRGVATYSILPKVGTISSIDLSSSNTLLIRGGDNSLVEWELGSTTPTSRLLLSKFSYTSTDAQRRWFAYHTNDGVIRLRNLETGEQVELQQTSDTPWDLVVSPTGNHVAAAISNGDIILWNNSAQRLAKYSRAPGVYQSLRFAPDGSLLATCGRDGELLVWSTKTIRHLTTSRCDGLANIDYAFSSDNTSLVIGYRTGAIEQISVDQEPVHTKERTSTATALGAITKIVPGPGSSMFVGTDRGQILLYDTRSHLITWTAQITGGVTAAAYSAHYDLLFIGSSDGHLTMITRDGRLSGTLQGHRSRISAISLSVDFRWLASGSADGAVRIWALPVPAIRSAHIAAAPLFSTRFSADGELVATESQDGSVAVCIVKTLECSTAIAHKSLAFGLAWSHDDTVLASTGWDGRLRLWERNSREAKYLSLSPDTGAVYLVGFLKNNKSVLLYFQGKKWKIQNTNNPQAQPALTFGYNTSLALSNDGTRLVALTREGGLSIWDASLMNPKVLNSRTLSYTEATSPALVASRSARFVVAIFTSGVALLLDNSEQTSRRVSATVDGSSIAPILTSFSPNEDFIALEYPDGRIATTNLITRETANYTPFATRSISLQAGRYRMVAITREGDIWIYDRISQSQCASHVEWDSAYGASLDPSERFIAIAGESGSLYLYDIDLCHWVR